MRSCACGEPSSRAARGMKAVDVAATRGPLRLWLPLREDRCIPALCTPLLAALTLAAGMQKASTPLGVRLAGARVEGGSSGRDRMGRQTPLCVSPCAWQEVRVRRVRAGVWSQAQSRAS